MLPNGTDVSIASTGTFNMNGFDDTVVSLSVDNNGTFQWRRWVGT